MYVKLLQRFGLDTDVAKHLAATYGDRAWSVCSIAEPTGQRWPVHGIRLDPLYPYIEAEVRYACRSEYAATVQDFIARRSRLSFLNAEATVSTLPRIIDIMAEELGWDSSRQEAELRNSVEFLGSMGLQPPRQQQLASMGLKELKDQLSASQSVSHLSSSALDRKDELATGLSRAQFTPEELSDLRRKFERLDVNGDGRLDAGDVSAVLKHLGYRDVSESTLERIVGEVDFDRSGALAFENFLDVAAALKDVRLSNAFTDIIKELDDMPDPIGPSAKERSDRREQSRKIPAERSGGGW